VHHLPAAGNIKVATPIDAHKTIDQKPELRPKTALLRDAVICLLLALSVLAVFWQVRGFEFTGYDDEHYVARNRMVGEGLTLQGIWWAFTTGYFSYWHPLTWISHMLDVELFGMNAGAHHLMSVFIHIVSSICLFLGLRYITGSWQKSAFVAALFALHPTHVESVAWIAERKDVLSGFFWILCIWAYGWYARQPSFWRYATALTLFACGLMSKPMVVTLPCVLLLMDYWPLQRLTVANWKRLLLEKVPYFFGVLISCGVTLYSVVHGGAIIPDERFSWGLRIANTPISYVRYLGKLFWPTDLAVLYPMPAHWESWKAIGAALLLLALTGVFVALARRASYLIVGWLWYLGTLFPTIGLISVGLQSIADRYTYIPFIGLFIMIAWGVPDAFAILTSKRQRTTAVQDTSRVPAGFGVRQSSAAFLAVIAFVACALVSWRQVQHWRDTETLFAQCVRATTNNPEAVYNLALAQLMNGKRQDALRNFREAVRLRPQYQDARNNLGLLLLELGDPQGATNIFTGLLRLHPTHEIALLNMGRALAQLGDYAQAKGYLELARSAEARLELGRLLEKQQRTNEAQIQFREAERLKPGITSQPVQSLPAPARP
jgi:tetratricopeptide (TPR) repeat protein